MSDDAVSPVIGTILMVAIAVILAGVVFVLATILAGDPPQTAPPIAFVQDEQQDRILAVAPSQWTWSEGTVHSSHILVMDQNDPAGLGDAPLTAAGVALTGGPVKGGDYLSFCAVTPQQAVTIAIADQTTGSIVREFLFDDIKACP